MRAAARQEAVGRGVVPARGYLRLAAVAAVIWAALLAGFGSTGLAQKSPPNPTGLPTTRNACRSSFSSGARSLAGVDLTIIAAANYVSRGDGPSGPSSSGLDMHASWSVTYRNLRLSLPSAAELALSINEPEGDIIKMAGGGPQYTRRHLREGDV